MSSGYKIDYHHANEQFLYYCLENTKDLHFPCAPNATIRAFITPFIVLKNAVMLTIRNVMSWIMKKSFFNKNNP